MKTKQTSPARAAMKLLCTLLGILFLVMLTATLYFGHLLGRIQYQNPVASVQLSQAELDTLLSQEGGSPDAGEVAFPEHDTIIGGKNSGILNILLIGQDRREGETQARSDSMILCTFDKEAKKLTMTSFLRDLYVQIPGYNNNRINAAYAAGGSALLEKTMKKNFGIHIDGCVEVDFTQFADIVDLLEGVKIELRQDEAEIINRETGSALTEGLQTLNGKQALTYSRIRKLDADGDFSRTDRQRKVITALLDGYKDAGLSKILSLVNQVLPMISTDMNGPEILTYAMELFPILSGGTLVSQYVPAQGTYTDKTVNGMSVLVADMDAVREMLEESLLPQ